MTLDVQVEGQIVLSQLAHQLSNVRLTKSMFVRSSCNPTLRTVLSLPIAFTRSQRTSNWSMLQKDSWERRSDAASERATVQLVCPERFGETGLASQARSLTQLSGIL